MLFLCTGNAARSVMAGVALRTRRPDLSVETAGTLTVDGLPISWRTRAALDAVGLAWPVHASKQATRLHLDAADVVVVMEPDHVNWVRRNHAHVAGRTTTLRHLVHALAPVGPPLPERIASLGLATRPIEPGEEVVDPGGGEVEDFVAAARQIVDLVDRLAPRL